MNGNIQVKGTGEFVSVSKGNNVTHEQGQGVIATKDGRETANYTFIDVGIAQNIKGLQYIAQILQGNYLF